jgi:signal transduction histidine kinase
MTSSRIRLWRPIVVFAVSLFFTGIAVWYSISNTSEKDLARFENRLQRMEDLIRSRLDTYIVLLQSWAFQFASGTPVRPEDCRALIERLDLERGYPGIAKLGFSLRIRPGDEANLDKWIALHVRADLRIQLAGDGSERYPIVILEPHQGENSLLGYDTSLNPILKTAMSRAGALGMAAASGKVDLSLEGGNPEGAGFLIYVPVYRGGLVPVSPESRRKELEGFVHGSFRLSELLGGLTQGQTTGVGFEIYAGDSVSQDLFMYRSFDAKEAAIEPQFTRTVGMDIAGQRWTVLYRTTSDFSQASEGLQALIVLGLGLAAGGALFGASWLQERASAKLRGSEEYVRELNLSLESRVKERTAELEAANKALEAFSYSVSHDLRGPLRILDGFSQMLVDRYAGALDEQGRNYLERVLSTTKQMSLLVDGFLELARVTRREMTQKVVDLSDLTCSIIAELRARDPQRNADVVVLPGVSANGDPQLLHAALNNLLQNAWKFTSRKALARIEFGVIQKNGDTACFVRDNGAGFDMAAVDRLFRPFERLHKAEEFPGMGVGLATVQRIIERHAGRLWAEGVPNGGATFFFTLGSGITATTSKDPGKASIVVTGRKEGPIA